MVMKIWLSLFVDKKFSSLYAKYGVRAISKLDRAAFDFYFDVETVRPEDLLQFWLWAWYFRDLEKILREVNREDQTHHC